MKNLITSTNDREILNQERDIVELMQGKGRHRGYLPSPTRVFLWSRTSRSRASLAVHNTQHFLRMAAAAALEARIKNPSFLWMTHENMKKLWSVTYRLLCCLLNIFFKFFWSCSREEKKRKLKQCWMASNLSCLLKLHIFWSRHDITFSWDQVICTASNLVEELHTCFSMEGCHNVATSPHSIKVTGLTPHPRSSYMDFACSHCACVIISGTLVSSLEACILG